MYLNKNSYFAMMIGNMYKKSEVMPFGFYCMDMIKRNFKVKVKGTISNNINGNRGEPSVGSICRYKTLNNNDYIFKKEF